MALSLKPLQLDPGVMWLLFLIYIFGSNYKSDAISKITKSSLRLINTSYYYYFFQHPLSSKNQNTIAKARLGKQPVCNYDHNSKAKAM